MTRMRWDCGTKGCRLVHRTDPALLDGCFPGRISMGDLDGIVELKGHLWINEFKRAGTALPLGQELTLRELARHSPLTRVYVVVADGQDVAGWRLVTPDKVGPLVSSSSTAFRDMATAWSDEVVRCP